MGAKNKNTCSFKNNVTYKLFAWMHKLDAKHKGEKAWRQLYKQILEVTAHKTAAIRSPTSHLEDHPS